MTNAELIELLQKQPPEQEALLTIVDEDTMTTSVEALHRVDKEELIQDGFDLEDAKDAEPIGIFIKR